MVRKSYLPFGKPNFSDEEIAAVTRVLRSGWVGMGQETILFEKELAEYLDVPHVVTVNSCTSALFLSLLVHGIGPGDEVICPSLTWCSTANVIVHLGAKPIFCDVDSDTFCITPESVEEKLTQRTKAVIPVHFGGLAVEIKQIRSVIPDNVVIIEDAAHALGSRFLNGNPIGSSGNMTCFSFYANKNLSTGEGGAIALFDEGQASRLRALRQHGMPVDAWKRFSQPKAILSPELVELGFKMNYTDLQASIARVQLKRQPEFYSIRLQIARAYYDRLNDLPFDINFQTGLLESDHARHLFMIRLPVEDIGFTRDDLLIELRKRNIGASIHYPPLHLMSFYASQDQAVLKNTENICKRIMTLPISASMNIDDAKYVLKNLKELLS